VWAQKNKGEGMRILASWRRMAVAGSAAALFATTVALTPGAAAGGSLHACPNKVFAVNSPGAYGETLMRKEHITAISSQGVSCSAADKFIKQEITSTTGNVEGYKCRSATFKVPLGYIAIACKRSGSKIQFGRHGG
jgi:hypothetical protein